MDDRTYLRWQVVAAAQTMGASFASPCADYP